MSDSKYPFVPRDMWVKVLDMQKKSYDLFKKRVPLTILANRRTLNLLVAGFDDDRFPRFEKVTFKGAYGDIHFFEHRGMDDGEAVFL